MVVDVWLEDEWFLDGSYSQLAHLLLNLSFIIKINWRGYSISALDGGIYWKQREMRDKIFLAIF